MTKLYTIERFILDHQPKNARGDFTYLLYDLALAAKLIAHKTRRAGLVEILGEADEINVQGEQQQKLDVYADEIIYRACSHAGRLCIMASEEREEAIPIPDQHELGEYVLVYDPLDGSSNIDVNVSIGTIFGIYRCRDWDQRGRIEDLLQPGKNLVAAGYVLYGSSTMLIYSTGQGVHAFTLDPELGEFLLSHDSLRFPAPPSYYSINGSRYPYWSAGTQRYLDWLQGRSSEGRPSLSLRYLGSLVADFHRNLLCGGVFSYPAEQGRPQGKIRLLYEAAPLAFLAEQAGGYASDGTRSILEIEPTDIHQRVPIYVGNRSLVQKAEDLLNQAD
jgi:fructose-1,6-bisphosphatase I